MGINNHSFLGRRNEKGYPEIYTEAVASEVTTTDHITPTNHIQKYCMLKDTRLQWHIAWRKARTHQVGRFWLIIILVEVSTLFNMGYARKAKYDYIPFGVVLKKNFLLQEEVAELNQQLSAANNAMLIYEQRIDRLISEKAEENCRIEREFKGF